MGGILGGGSNDVTQQKAKTKQKQSASQTQTQKTTQNTTQTQNQTNTYTPRGLGIMQGVANRAEDVASLPYNEIIRGTAGLTPAQQQAMENVNVAYSQVQPYMNTAAQYFQEAAQPLTAEDINQYYNPYSEAVMANLQETFGTQRRDAIGKFQGQAGGIGANRIAVAEAELARQQGLAGGQTMAGVYQNALQAAQNQQGIKQASAYGLGQLGPAQLSAALSAAQAQFGMGQWEQMTEQQRLDAVYSEAMAQEAFPYQQAQWYAGMALPAAGMMGGTTTGTATMKGTSTGTGTAKGTSKGTAKGTQLASINPPDPNPFSQLVGGLTAIGGFFAKDGGGVKGYAQGGSPFNSIFSAQGYVPTMAGMSQAAGGDAGGDMTMADMGDMPTTDMALSQMHMPQTSFLPMPQPGSYGGAGGKGSNLEYGKAGQSMGNIYDYFSGATDSDANTWQTTTTPTAAGIGNYVSNLFSNRGGRVGDSEPYKILTGIARGEGGQVEKAKGGGTGDGGSDFGWSDVASLVSPLYAMTQGKSPFAGGLLGMAIPGMGPTNEQASGLGSLLTPGGLLGQADEEGENPWLSLGRDSGGMVPLPSVSFQDLDYMQPPPPPSKEEGGGGDLAAMAMKILPMLLVKHGGGIKGYQDGGSPMGPASQFLPNLFGAIKERMYTPFEPLHGAWRQPKLTDRLTEEEEPAPPQPPTVFSLDEDLGVGSRAVKSPGSTEIAKTSQSPLNLSQGYGYGDVPETASPFNLGIDNTYAPLQTDEVMSGHPDMVGSDGKTPVNPLVANDAKPSPYLPAQGDTEEAPTLGPTETLGTENGAGSTFTPPTGGRWTEAFSGMPLPYKKPKLFGKELDNTNLAIIAAGLSMMGGRSPYFGVNVGEGGMQGVATLKEFQELDARRQGDALDRMLRAGQLDNSEAQLMSLEKNRVFTQGNDMIREGWIKGDKAQVEYGKALLKRFGFQDPTSAMSGQPAEAPNVEYPEGADPNLAVNTSAVPDNVDAFSMQYGSKMGQDRAKYDSKEVFDETLEKAKSAREIRSQLHQARHYLDAMPESGLLVGGSFHDQRVAFAKALNTIKRGVSNPKTRAEMEKLEAETEVVGNSEAIIKLQTYMGFSLARTLGTREAMQVIQQALNAVTGGQLTPAGAKNILYGVMSAADMDKDRYNFIDAWKRKSDYGSTVGADSYFDEHVGPVSKYSDQRVSLYKKLDKARKLAKTPEELESLRQIARTQYMFDDEDLADVGL